ncbi:hypothetical protein BDD12DRAFT_747314, partial [Trichophaea hybrida]
LSHDFNARNLDRLAGISIWFTANLADHLIYDPDTNRLQIYHYNSFLTAHLVNRSSVCFVFDETFLRETQQTLNLIFPCHDKVNNTDVDPTLRNVAPMPYTFHPSEFQFYGARLEVLKDALNSARHASTKQLWFDRRNRHAWCALWVAVVIFVLTVIFGVISSVTSIMQVRIAMKGAQAGRGQGI